jgi:hypothetical protein
MTSMEVALWAGIVVASFANIVLCLNLIYLQRVNARLKDAVRTLLVEQLRAGRAAREVREGEGEEREEYDPPERVP